MNGLLEQQAGLPLLILHIGGAKAGSTAVQAFLAGNRTALEAISIAVPNTELELSHGDANQIWFFENLINKPDAAAIIAKKVDAVANAFRERRGAPPRAIVLSAENLANDHDLAGHFGALEDRYTIAVLLYVRRQEDAYQAAWQQWYAKVEPDLDAWIASSKGHFCDWAAATERWEAIRPNTFVVRIYDRKALVGNDIVDDFCAVLGLNLSGLERLGGEVNMSFGIHVSELYRAMPGVFDNEHDLRVEALLYETENKAARKRSGETIFSRRQLQLIRDRHSAGNARIKARYFPDLPDGPLFPPVSEDDATQVAQEEINRRNIGVIGELAFAAAFAQKKRDSDFESWREQVRIRFAEIGKQLDLMDERLRLIGVKSDSVSAFPAEQALLKHEPSYDLPSSEVREQSLDKKPSET